MKHIIIIFIVFLMSTMGFAQTVTRNGDTFKVEQTSKSTENAITKFTWIDNKGISYPVYKSSRNSFYIIKISKKSGKEYKQYLPKDIQDQMAKELGIEKK